MALLDALHLAVIEEPIEATVLLPNQEVLGYRKGNQPVAWVPPRPKPEPEGERTRIDPNPLSYNAHLESTSGAIRRRIADHFPNEIGRGGEMVAVHPCEHDAFAEVVKYHLDPRHTPAEAQRLYLERAARQSRLQDVLKARLGAESEEMRVATWFVLKADDGVSPVEGCHQEYVPEMEMDGPRFELRGRYAELSRATSTLSNNVDAEPGPDIDPVLYQRVNEILLQGIGTERFSVDEFLEVQSTEELSLLVNELKHNEPLAAFLRRSLPALMEYADQHGEVLDTAGRHNIIFFEKGDEGEYTMRLPDAIHPNAHMLSEAGRSIRRLADGQATHAGDLVTLLNAVNHVRLMNGLCAVLGLPDRLELIPPDVAKRGAFDFGKLRQFLRLDHDQSTVR